MRRVPQAVIRWRRAPRVIPSRFPAAGLFDRVAGAADLEAVFELEWWTNDRISAEIGLLQRLPKEEWVVGRPMASVIMAAYCHPRVGGARFSDGERGAWYAARSIDTALAESIYHRTRELGEVGGYETHVQMRVYLADFSARFHDVRTMRGASALYDREDYGESQRFARGLLDAGANGLVYRSVRHAGGECLACFRPALVRNVRVGGHYELRWEGRPEPVVRKL
ncbi:MAG: RES family NAD+ phosphorylase [Vicinamibacterales bacterium]